jgi:YVTN family beta-propeller protein
MRVYIVAALLVTVIAHSPAVEKTWISHAPAGSSYTQIVRDGATVIPNGRLLTPRGRQITVAPHPYGLILSPDGSIAVTANSGTRPFSVSIIRDVVGTNPAVRQIPEGYEGDQGILASVYMGLAISPDNKVLYVAGGQEGMVFLFDLNSGARLGEINCNTPMGGVTYADSYIGDMVLSKDGSMLYAVDQMNFRVLVIDPAKRILVASVGVGRYPFGITLSPDGKQAYVANVGVFVYKPITSLDPKKLNETALRYPPFAYMSKEMREGINTDSLKVPGLGDPNVPESFSVWTLDLSDPVKPVVTAKVKTGHLVGEMVEGIPAVGGASPNSVVATDRYVFVSNGNNDCVSVIDAGKHKVTKNILLRPDQRLGKLRGVIPYGLALSPGKKRLYVAESGINAVAVIDVPSLKVLGHIPTGWFPSKLKVSNDGRKLIVANAKGYGSGPNGGQDFHRTGQGSYIGNLMNGTVSVIDIPADAQLAVETGQVIRNNFALSLSSSAGFASRKANPIPLYPNQKQSPIKHIIFIAKENRTFDEVFGQVQGARGDSTLSRFGANRNIKTPQGDVLRGVTVAANHLKLASRFGIADNFYCDSDVSADGHRWLADTYPNEWVETNTPASYGGGREPKFQSSAPGTLAITGSSISIYPEDFNEAGSLWDHLERGHVDFFNFGLGLQFAHSLEEMAFKHTGVRFTVNYPVPAPLYHRSSQMYPTWNMSIPDQFRADMFIKEFNERWMGKGKTLPRMLTVYLPNDHGAGVRPDAGYPFTESYMMDNDLALGRIIEFVSHTPYWKNMAVVVTEDDPQGGVDHVDAHRSLLMVISPFAKKGYVSHVHYSFGSAMKTFWNVLGLPCLNQYDFGASDLADFFTDTPDFTPYRAVPVDPEVFNPEKALDPLDEKFDWSAFHQTPKLDDPELMKKWSDEDAANRGGEVDAPFAPVITAGSTIFMDSTVVSMKNPYQSVTIRYSLDGSEPSVTSPVYETPLTVKQTTTLKARSFWKNGVASRTSIVALTKGSLRLPDRTASGLPGLQYSYYEDQWVELPDFSTLKDVKNGVVPGIDINAIKGRDNSWGVVYTGYIDVPSTGAYTFYVSSDDGSKLYIGDSLMVNNDGLHGTTEKSCDLLLQAGKHKMKLIFFQATGGAGLTMSYRGPGIEKKEVPASAFSH